MLFRASKPRIQERRVDLIHRIQIRVDTTKSDMFRPRPLVGVGVGYSRFRCVLSRSCLVGRPVHSTKCECRGGGQTLDVAVPSRWASQGGSVVLQFREGFVDRFGGVSGRERRKARVCPFHIMNGIGRSLSSARLARRRHDASHSHTEKPDLDLELAVNRQIAAGGQCWAPQDPAETGTEGRWCGKRREAVLCCGEWIERLLGGVRSWLVRHTERRLIVAEWAAAAIGE